MLLQWWDRFLLTSILQGNIVDLIDIKSIDTVVVQLLKPFILYRTWIWQNIRLTMSEILRGINHKKTNVKIICHRKKNLKNNPLQSKLRFYHVLLWGSAYWLTCLRCVTSEQRPGSRAALAVQRAASRWHRGAAVQADESSLECDVQGRTESTFILVAVSYCRTNHPGSVAVAVIHNVSDLHTQPVGYFCSKWFFPTSEVNVCLIPGRHLAAPGGFHWLRQLCTSSLKQPRRAL